MAADNPLWGVWETEEVSGTTTLDWTGLLKAGDGHKAVIAFSEAGDMTVTILDPAGQDVTDSVSHMRRASRFALEGDRIDIEGDPTGVVWTYSMFDDQLVLKLTGASSFGRCRGVDQLFMNPCSASGEGEGAE